MMRFWSSDEGARRLWRGGRTARFGWRLDQTFGQANILDFFKTKDDLVIEVIYLSRYNIWGSLVLKIIKDVPKNFFFKYF